MHCGANGSAVFLVSWQSVLSVVKTCSPPVAALPILSPAYPAALISRRHLTESQRASIAARLANMPRGGAQYRTANLQTDSQRQFLEVAPIDAKPQVSAAAAAAMLNVSERSVATARKVQEYGAPELVAAVDSGITSVSAAALAFVISTNLHRRHLTESQRASIAARLANIEFGHNQFTRGSANLPTLLPETPPPRSVTPSG